MVVVFPILPRKDMILHALAPWERKTNKIEMEDERIKPEKVKNTKFGLFYSKIYRNSKNTPVLVDGVDNDREHSLLKMRREMILEKGYTSAVFIGGMEGVIEEFKLFRELQPDVKLLPVASTGAASLKLYEDYNFNILELKSELTYATLFQKLLL